MIATLRQRDFALAWLGGLISMMGDWVLYIALPLYVYQLTGSTLATSAMFIAELIPALLFGSVAGVFVDRWDRKRTMVISNLLLAVTLLPLLAVRSADWVWVAYLVGFVQSSNSQFFRPAENALLPRLVDEERLLNANSLNALNNNLARLLGPAVGGSVMGLYGISAVVLVDAVSFLAAAGMIALISTSGRIERAGAATTEVAQRAWRKVWQEWMEGVTLVRRHRAVALLLGLNGVALLGEGVFSVMFVVWVGDVLGGGSRELGWLMSAQAVGGLLGGVLFGSIADRFSPVRLLGVGSIIFGILDLALFNYPLFVSGIWIGIALIGLVGIPTIGIGAGFTTLLQRAVRDEYRGRVFGIMGTTSALLQLAGTVIAGVLGGVLGPIVLLNIQGGSYVLMGLLALVVLPMVLPREVAERTSPDSTVGAGVRSD
ncbi:MAG: MFS transporter [Chloroflexota bacterium]|nr:MFS transporter [Chloroflexota bacterium]